MAECIGLWHMENQVKHGRDTYISILMVSGAVKILYASVYIALRDKIFFNLKEVYVAIKDALVV